MPKSKKRSKHRSSVRRAKREAEGRYGKGYYRLPMLKRAKILYKRPW